jgi:hypothetical protein
LEETLTATKTTLDGILKELYAGQSVEELVYEESSRPLLTLLKKNTSFAGVGYPLPVVYEDIAGRSATFTTAQGNVAGSKITQFLIDTVANYSVARITTDALLRARNDKGAFINGLKHEIDSAIRRLSNDIESSLFRDGSGSIGVVGSGIAGTTITLASADDVVNFAVGMKVVTTAAGGAGAVTSGAARTVLTVDRDAGTFTISAAFAGTSADTNLIMAEGDYVSAADRLKIKGLDAWIPSTAPSSAAFFSVDRSVDPTRLGGLRYTGNAAAIEESIVGGAARLGRECGAIPDVALMNYSTFRRLVNELGSKVQRDQGKSATGGFQSMDVYGPRGLISCKPATFCQDNIIWLLTSGSWQLISMNEPVQILDQDGSKVLRVSNADALEVRVGSFSQLACNAPGKNVRISL